MNLISIFADMNTSSEDFKYILSMGNALLSMVLVWILNVEIKNYQDRNQDNNMKSRKYYISLNMVQSIFVIVISSKVLYPLLYCIVNIIFYVIGETCHYTHIMPMVPAVMVLMGWLLLKFERQTSDDNNQLIEGASTTNLSSTTSVSSMQEKDSVFKEDTIEKEYTSASTTDTQKWRFVCNTLSDSEMSKPVKSKKKNWIETTSMVRLTLFTLVI